MKKLSSKFSNDEEVERFLEGDLSKYLTSENLRPVTFEFEPKEKIVNLRISTGLLDRIKTEAKALKMPYQKYIRKALELSLRRQN